VGLNLLKLSSRTHPLLTQCSTPRCATSLFRRTHAVLCNVVLLKHVHATSRDSNMPRPDGLHGGGKFVPLHVLAKQQREERAEKAKHRSLNKEAVVTKEDDDPSSEESMELHRRDPDLCHRRQLGQGMLAELTLETDVLVAPSPIETDPVMRPGCQRGGSCSSPCHSPRHTPEPNHVTDPKVNLSAILQCEGLTKEEADQFSSSADPDDDQDSNFDAFVDPVVAGSEADGGDETNENEEEVENAGEEESPDGAADDNGGSGGAADDAAGKASGGGDSTGGGGSNGADDEDGHGDQEGHDKKASGDEDDDDGEEDGEEEEGTAEETPRVRSKSAPTAKRARKETPGQCTLSRSSMFSLGRVMEQCCVVAQPGSGALLRGAVWFWECGKFS